MNFFLSDIITKINTNDKIESKLRGSFFDMNEERKFRRELRKLKIAVWFIVLCAIVNPFFTIKQDVENSKNTPRQKAKEISFSEVESAFQNKVKGEQNIDQPPRQEEQTTIEAQL